MTESEIPPYVDTRKVFQQTETLKGTIEFDRLPRFQDCLLEIRGNVHVELEFSTNKSKQRVITGKLSAPSSVACQRCLEAVQIEVTDSFQLALVKKEADIDKLDDLLDPWFCEDHKLDVAAMVEEQLLLCLPLVSKHDDKNCLSSLGYEQQDKGNEELEDRPLKESPFAILKVLKD
ncbi:MAG: DUF177 domain-containing protein [Pseudohongiellaceae bacterium]